jgi:hypothetical protein
VRTEGDPTGVILFCRTRSHISVSISPVGIHEPSEQTKVDYVRESTARPSPRPIETPVSSMRPTSLCLLWGSRSGIQSGTQAEAGLDNRDATRLQADGDDQRYLEPRVCKISSGVAQPSRFSS